MNETVNKFLLVGDKLMPEILLKQPGFTSAACGPFKKKKKRKNWNVYTDGNSDFIYRN